MRMGFFELVIILVIVAMVIGPKQIPKLTEVIAESIKSIRHIQSAANEDDQAGDSSENSRQDVI